MSGWRSIYNQCEGLKKYSVFLILDVAKIQSFYTELIHINPKENEIGFLNGNCRYMSNHALHSFDQQGAV